LRKVFIYLLLVSLFFTKKAHAQSISNEGTDFWAIFPTHIPSGNNLAKMTVFISSKSNSSGTITVGSQKIPFTVFANGIASIDIPRTDAYINDVDANKTISNKSIHILVDQGQPKVAAYAHIYARARSEAYLILPIESHGRKYFGMSTSGLPAPGGTAPGRSYIVVVATADNTVINVTRSNLTKQKITLPKIGDIFEILADEDLSGTKLEMDDATSSCKTFAAFSGHSGIALYNGSYDPLLQQLYPTASWGKIYGVIPFAGRTYFTQVVASEDNTIVKIDNINAATLKAGEVYSPQRKITEPMLISADKPISVAQFSFSQDETNADPEMALLGDPDMVILNPLEYSIKNITVFSSSLEIITNKYINVYMRTKARDSFKINGRPPASEWKIFLPDPTYSYLQEPVVLSTLTLTADDGFNAIAYGFGDHESYAYSAGTNLATNQFLLLKNKVTNQETTAACLGQPSDFILTLPYKLTKIVWKDANGLVIHNDTAPSPTSTVVNGQTLYKYFAPVNLTFSTIGTAKFMATASIDATPESCVSGDLELNFIFDIDPLPTAAFQSQVTGCADEELIFKDLSTSNTDYKPITKWLWDFGDGKTSTEENPKHIYSSSGSFTIRLIVGAQNGCYSDVSAEKTIIIKPKVNAKFTAKTNTCIETEVTFIDQSFMDVGNVVKWVWDMGDGKTPQNRTSSAAFNYKFDSPGKYTISLIAHGDNGCISLPYTQEITVTALPISDFEIPDVCVKDGETIFKNLSTNIDGTTNGLTYLWNFDDPSSGAANTSTNVDGKHQFTVARNYNITLTITNDNGCVKVEKKVFTVNGKDPVADFEILNKNSLCSNHSFTVISKADVLDFGRATRIDWFINGVKQDIPPAPKPSYDFTFPESTSDQTINLMMIVYSGTTCFAVHDETFKLLASPKLTLNVQQPLCLNAQPVQLIAKEIGGLSGKGKFSGKGVSIDGIFDPRQAGAGNAVITYTFNADNGCFQSISQTITVYPIPEIYAGKDEYILIGGERKLEAIATGQNLTFKWTPSIGLDRDDILNPTVKPEQNTNYTLTVTSGNGCVVIDQVYIYLLNDVKVPNSITPNGDGINDVWNVKYLDSYPQVTVEIFNRNGQRIYFSRGYSVPFDGNFNNQTLPVGTYYYIINPNTGGKRITGNLTIIR
jgi:gliding motility-associated-like protein